MAQGIITKEELLENAYEIADEHGVSALSVRGLAARSGVSVGTVYRFFPAKDDLTVQTIELYFVRAFYDDFCHLDGQAGFVDYCERMHASMRDAIGRFRERWLRGSESLPAAERAAARVRESAQIEHVARGLAGVYDRDPMIASELPEGFDAQSVSRFALGCILASLRRGDGDCRVLFGLLRSTLYRE